MPLARSPGRRRAGSRPEREPNAHRDDPEKAREAALRLLERTRRTRSDLARRLRDKGHAPAMVDALLDRLAGVGLVDDIEYARAYLAGRWGRRMAGWRRLENELRRRGVTAADVAEARGRIERDIGPVSDIGAARRVVAQARRRLAALDPHARRRRLYGLLVRRGFERDVIGEILRAEE
jgi:regulatory protein